MHSATEALATDEQAGSGHAPRALALLSGGLDSMLAVKLIQAQGLEVEAINFSTGFAGGEHSPVKRESGADRGQLDKPAQVAEQLGIALHRVDVSQAYKDVLLAPRYGYGANMNPCLDCKVFMIRQALTWMSRYDFDFVITGEVIGQRPMSQRRDTLPVIAAEADANDRLLRPLSAQQLEPTLPERAGWVDRNQLLGMTGRSRKPQLALARHSGLADHVQPAGGCCLLTDAGYSRKLRDLIAHSPQRDYRMEDITLLKVGRHLRLHEQCKLIVARDGEEAIFLEAYCDRFVWLEPVHCGGPVTLIQGVASAADRLLAAQITARYSQGRKWATVDVAMGRPDGQREVVTVAPLEREAIPNDWYL